MPRNRQQHKSPVLTEECSYCGSIVYIEVEETTADEYNDTIVSDKAHTVVSKDVSQEKRLVPHHKIREAITRLRDEYGFGILDKKGENNDKETLRVNGNDDQEEDKPRRVDDIQGQPGIGSVHNF